MNINYTLIPSTMPVEVNTVLATVALNREPSVGDIIRDPVANKFYKVKERLLYQNGNTPSTFRTENYLMVQEYSGGEVTGSVYNQIKATQITGANSYTIPGGSSHKIQIVCTQGVGKLTIDGTIINIAETFSTVLDATIMVDVEVKAETATNNDIIIIIEQY